LTDRVRSALSALMPVLDDIDTLFVSLTLLECRPIQRPAKIQGHALVTTETWPVSESTR
jgi:hypothetical protein